MRNPWEELPQASPYVLPEDCDAVNSFNHGTNDDHMIRLELLPEPFLGDPNAPIILLSLNPGFSEYDQLLFADERGRELCLKNLTHVPMDYPFYLLDPSIARFPGPKWWRQRLGAPIRAAGIESIATRICCVELFPYHSRKYRSLGRILESQKYGFHLVELAMDRNALIVAMRSRAKWIDVLPLLSSYEHFHTCSNWQRPYISRGNLPEIYPSIEEILLR